VRDSPLKLELSAGLADQKPNSTSFTAGAAGNIVPEDCNLICASLPDHLELHCEVQYAKFVRSRELPKILQGKIRADLVIAEKPVRAGSDPVPEFIVAVKRASTSKGLIEADLQRLAAAFGPMRAPFSLSFPKQIGQKDLFSRKDVPSEENI
jgi:hypothetical protein